MVRITDDTRDLVRYVMDALKLRQYEMCERLGLSPGTLSRILGGVQTYTTLTIFQIYSPRLTRLVEQADRGRGESSLVTDPGVRALNPVSTPEAKDFILAPYRQAYFDKRRENHRAAMKAYWVRRKAKAPVKAADRVEAPAKTPPMTREGFFQRVWNSIRTGFHAFQ